MNFSGQAMWGECESCPGVAATEAEMKRPVSLRLASVQLYLEELSPGL